LEPNRLDLTLPDGHHSAVQSAELQKALIAATQAAETVGASMRRQLHALKKATAITPHDIKLELDVSSQKSIERKLRAAFPCIGLLGEEGVSGATDATCRWVVDPIDGTVNFAYGIPHASVSIALQERAVAPNAADYPDGYNTLVGVVYDPFCRELWTAVRGQRTRLNGKVIKVSSRGKLGEAMVAIGFAKTRKTLEETLPYFNRLVRRVRKVRMMGSAALALAYVATGRFDAYVERGIRLWDVAAGGLLIQSAGGEFWHKAVAGQLTYRMVASNGLLRRKLQVPG
jgi:myo-inositol-1(or 4)-monophosphatase